VLLLAALSLAVTTSAGKPAKPPLGTPVTVIVADEDYRIQRDLLGPYVNGADGVTAVIVPLGNLQLKTGSERAFWLDFGNCVSGTCGAPFTAEYRQGYMTTSCPTALLDMGVDASQECNLNLHFTADQAGWFIRFGEEYGTTPASVERVSLDSWTIDVQVGGNALLESYPLKGRVTWTPHGYYDMPVNLTVTLQ